jgi:flagellar basal body P-ring protein FlgI
MIYTLFKVSGEMGIIERKVIYIIVLQVICCISGCRTPDNANGTSDLGATIGSLVEVVYPESVSVEGYGLVAGLRGTGSMECPPQIRTYLTRYIMAQLSEDTISKAESLIDSPNTAVVVIEAVMPVLDAKGEYFDVAVTALPGTQTTSLEGGWLFSSEMKITGSFGIKTEILADAQGPVFMDKIGNSSIDKRRGFILAGGKSLTDYKVMLVVKRPGFELTNVIRNRLNQRFGRDIARAVSPDRIEVTVPPKYRRDRKRFISLVRMLYLNETPEIVRERINHYTGQLVLSPDSQESEVAIEAIGNQSLADLFGLLDSSDERVRLRAARCMLNLGNSAGLEPLRRIAMDRSSDYRLDALEAITSSAVSRQTAVTVARALLSDVDIDICLSAYEQLRSLNDVTITREAIGKNFFLEQIVRSERKMVYVTRSGQPRIVLFGAPIICNRDIFVQSPDKEITVNAPAGQDTISIIRAHPRRDGVVARMKSSFDLGDIIRTLCSEPLTADQEGVGGLGVSYADAIALLKHMCDKGAVNAEFLAGPLPKIGLNVKK